jgi:aspartate/methionine/tyrosine aminotransferase
MIASRIDSLFPSGIRAVMAMARERAASGLPVLHMEVGEPHFPTPTHIVEAAAEAARNGLTGYTPNAGVEGLRQAVADRVKERNGIAVEMENVCVTSGAVMGLFLALMAVIEPGDEVLVPDPGWPNYLSSVSLAGGVSVRYQLRSESSYTLELGELASRVSPRTRAIIVNFPGNPTGGVISRERMRELVRFADEHDLYVISDEVYEDFVFAGGGHHSVLGDGLGDRLIMVSGASKSYSMTGWRIGWMVSQRPIIDAAVRLVEPLTSCPSSLSQVAAEAALRGPQDCVTEMRKSYEQASRHVNNVLGPAGLLPSAPAGAFYALVDVASSGIGSNFSTRLLIERGVAVAPGSTFGPSCSGSIRISTAMTSDDLIRGCTIIKDFAAAQ